MMAVAPEEMNRALPRLPLARAQKVIEGGGAAMDASGKPAAVEVMAVP
jgi:hypothetical protein